MKASTTTKSGSRCGLKDSIILAAVPSTFQGSLHRSNLKSHLWKNGHLVFGTEAEQSSCHLSIANGVPPLFDPQFVLQSLDYCKAHHKKLCQAPVDIPKTRLIDCYDRSYVFSTELTKYAALSYVWATQVSNPDPKESVTPCNQSALPPILSQTIENAIEVTKELGLRYLWVDKYCINQDNNEEKSEQIRQMDTIYKGSEFTIIAAAGYDENDGLPGVGSTTRTSQPVISYGNLTITATMPHPHHIIKGARWSTRGWTLQESILARRRLVFTENQVYFECNAMNCFESLSIPLDVVHTKTKDRFFAFMRSGLFNGRDEGLDREIFGLPFGNFDDRGESWDYNMRKFLILATNFTSRNLTDEADSLNAFVGIMKQLEGAKYPITQIQGIPYVHTSVFPDQDTHLDSLMAGLCWRHIRRWNGNRHKVKRRTAFPTWTWAGWSGAVSWTDLFTYDEMDLVSMVDNMRCELINGTLMTLKQYTSQRSSHKLAPPLALRFSAWLLPPTMISRDDETKMISWKIREFRLELHMSEFEGTPTDFVEHLSAGKLRCFFVAKGIYNSYFLILDVLGRRTGVAEAIWSEDRHDRRFANEVQFFGPKTDIRLI